MANQGLAKLNPTNQELSKKFEEARRQKVEFKDFIKNFLMQFVSKQTIRSYEKDLLLFFDFLRSGGEKVIHPRDIEAYHFQLYRDDLLEKKYSSATINRRLVAIRSFIKWAMACKLIEHNPLDAVKLPKSQCESPTQAFDDEEVSQMISAPQVSEFKGNLHRLTMVLLFYLGLRRSELVNIKLEHFLQERGHFVLKIKGKGDKIRIMPLSPTVRTEIQAYLERLEHFKVQLAPSDYLLQANKKSISNKPIDGSTIYRLINKYALKLGINKKVSPHSCRATAISHLLDTKNVGIRDVAIFAGHSQITTTERYDKRRNNLDKSAAYDIDFD